MRRAPLAALLRLLLLLLAGGISKSNPYVEDPIDLTQVWVEIPSAPVALEGDLHVKVHGVIEPATLRVRITRDDDDGRTILATMPLALDAERRLALPCGYFPRGGVYYLEIISDPKESYIKDEYDTNDTNNFSNINEIDTRTKVKRDVSVLVDSSKSKYGNENTDSGTVMQVGTSVVKSWRFDVMWPSARLAVTPEKIQTYPENEVTAIIEFPGVVCTPIESSGDFWLELLYCGHSSGGVVLCDGKNTSSHAQVLYSEQVKGFPGRRTMTLRCEWFGQAGDYALTLRPAAAAGPQDFAFAFVKADWSEQFVLNVHGGSVFPCGGGGGGGVRVLFQYPQCVLERADRVRVFGREGERLHYVTERRVVRGQHIASFDCRLFSERYPEYCFVYVSQAVTGAVTDVRMDCLPTSPLSEGAAGGWGEWSPWSSCPAPAHCSTRTRSRHRFCDSPPPAYGAKYCEGRAVELAACECAARKWPGDSAGVVSEVGARCRCGCVLHLAPAARLLAGSARACPARSFWLLQAEEGLIVRLRMEAVRLPCAGQALRARDGDSLAAPLLASWDGPDSSIQGSAEASTSRAEGPLELEGGRHILVELRSGDTSERCAGGFLAHAMQIEPIRNASVAWASTGGAGWWTSGGGARAAVLALAASAALAALALALHSAHRTRAYQRAADKESLTDSDACSASLELGAAGSRSTLLSEVVGGATFRRLLPSARAKHTRLRESLRISQNMEQRDAEDEQTDVEQEPCDESISRPASPNSAASTKTRPCSQNTITPEGASSSSAPPGVQIVHSPLKRSHTMSTAPVSTEDATLQPQNQSQSETVTADLSTSISSVSERDHDSCSEKDRDSAWEKDSRSESRASTSSAATLTNGWYSPALNGVRAARVRNPKRGKESCNRLLRSDLSLTSHPEMEIDYYDYEVNNAGSVPGSYLGMDPAFLVWIPPLEEGDIIREIDESKQPIYEEILPKELHPDPGSNTESPENDRPNRNLNKKHSNRSNGSEKPMRNTIDRTNIIHPLNFSISDLQNSPKVPRRNSNKKKRNPEAVSIPMKDLTLSNSPVRVHKKERNDYNNATLKRVTDTNREIRNSDTINRSLNSYDIKFADESSESSNEIKFDEHTDSNKLYDKFDVKI